MVCLLHAAQAGLPAAVFYPCTANKDMKAGGRPIYLVSSKAVNKIYFLGHIWQTALLDVSQQ